ncbi:MAG: HlyD family efflux transporter periplasmic adaptor subunit [Planctomycetota bacterium]
MSINSPKTVDTNPLMPTDLQHQSSATPNSASSSESDLLTQFIELAQSNLSRNAFFEAGFQLIASSLSAKWGLLEMENSGRRTERRFRNENLQSQDLLDLAMALSVESQMDRKASVQMIPQSGSRQAMLTCPLLDLENQCLAGSITIMMMVDDEQNAFQKLEQLKKASSALAESFPISDLTKSKPQPTNEASPELRAILSASKFENTRALAFALVNSYCQKLNADRAVMGLVDQQQVKILAISGMDYFAEKSPEVIGMQQAQSECLDYAQTVVVQKSESSDDASNNNLLLHRKWHNRTGSGAVASFPIQVDGKTIAVFSLQRPISSPFSNAEIEKIERAVEPFGTAIVLMEKSNRSLRSHAMDIARKNLIQPLKNKIIGIIVAASVAFFLFGWLPYRPTVPCEIQPGEVSHLISPYDAVLTEASLFAGDQVQSGQPVIQFDTREMELEKSALAASIQAKEIERNQALSEGNTIRASIADAEIVKLQVTLDSLKHKIELGSLTSKFDGQIIRGDLRKNIGQVIPKGTPLMQIAPNQGMRVELHIPESKASLIQVGQSGYFSAGTRPGDRHRFEIVKVTPATEIVQGKNVIVAEAMVQGDSDWMKTGMAGYARVHTGWQPVWWILTHPITDRLRLGFWL